MIDHPKFLIAPMDESVIDADEDADEEAARAKAKELAAEHRCKYGMYRLVSVFEIVGDVSLEKVQST